MKSRTYSLLHLVLAGCFLLFASCKEKPDPEPELAIENGVLVLNEGNFQGGNASLSFIDAAGTVHGDVYKTATQLPLGDVAQSMVLFDGDLFVVVNNSGRLLRLNLPDLVPVCTATGLVSPRFMQPVSASKAYVSDLYSRDIAILNPSTCSVTGHIATGGWTEEMLVHGGKCYAVQTGTNKLLIIDTASDLLIDSIAVGSAPVSLRMDAEERLWVLCDGGIGSDSSVLACLDTGADTVLRAFVFPNLSAFPSDLRMDPAGNVMYWLDAGIWQMGVHDAALPTQAWLPANGRNFYSLDIDMVSGNVLASDAKDFVQKGELCVYTPAGAELKRYTVGVNPGAVMVLE